MWEMVMIFSLIFIGFLFTHICEVRWTRYLVCESLHIIWAKGWLLPTLCRRRDLGCSRTQGGLKSPPKPNEPFKALTQRITSTVRSAKAREGKSWILVFHTSLTLFTEFTTTLLLFLEVLLSVFVSVLFTFTNDYNIICPDNTLQKQMILLEYF